MNLGLESAEIIDQYQRTFSSLRISLTGICNLGCSYCVPEKLTKSSIHTEVRPLPYHTLFDIVCQLGSILKFKNIRLTGGEPTLYPDLIPFTRLLKSQLTSTISLTTNGYLLKPLVKDLKDAGVSAINISLDTLQESTFSTLARSKSLHKILEAIEETIQLGIPVKINMVVMKGINSNEVLEMLNYCGERGITLRYLELMKMGHLYSNGKFNDLYYSESEILNLIGKEFSITKEERTKSSTSNYWMTSNGYRFGIIANESSPFCGDCDRLRLDSYGNLFGCLSKNEPIPVADLYKNTDMLIHQLKEALAQKQPINFTGSPLSMIEIGG